MAIQETIKEDIKAALKEKNELRLSVLRMAASAMKNKEIEKRAKSGEAMLTEEEAMAVLRSEVKKRRDAITGFTKGGRPELAEKETNELSILEQYLPQELSDEEIERIVKAVIQEIGTASMKDFGKVMGEAMKRVNGQASGDRVNKTVKHLLS